MTISIRVTWDTRQVMNGFEAVSDTFRKTGVGLSYYRPRKALEGETQKPPKAYLILGKIKKLRGRDPLEPPLALQQELQSMLTEECEELLTRAANSGRTQRDGVRRLLLAAAKSMREDAQDRIKKQETGFHGEVKYLKYKAKNYYYQPRHRAPQFRHMTMRFGKPLPLVLTGRLYDCITERWYEREPRSAT